MEEIADAESHNDDTDTAIVPDEVIVADEKAED